MMATATALVSHSIGQNAPQKARQQATSAIIINIRRQDVVAALLICFHIHLIALAGAPNDTAKLTAHYLALTLPSLPSLPTMTICIIGSPIQHAKGRGGQAMLVTLLVAGGISCLIDPIMIYYLCWWLNGAALFLIVSHVCIAEMALLVCSSEILN